jgi:hypothetical protein
LYQLSAHQTCEEFVKAEVVSPFDFFVFFCLFVFFFLFFCFCFVVRLFVFFLFYFFFFFCYYEAIQSHITCASHL